MKIDKKLYISLFVFILVVVRPVNVEAVEELSNNDVLSNYLHARDAYLQLKKHENDILESKSEDFDVQLLKAAKEMLRLKLDAVVYFLDELNTQLDEDENLGIAERTTIKALTRSYESQIETYRIDFESASSTEELNFMYATMFQETEAVLVVVKATSVVLSLSEGSNLISSTEETLSIIKIHMEAAQEAGNDIKEVEQLYINAQDKVDKAFISYSEGATLLEESALSAGVSNEFFNQVYSKVTEANGYLGEAIEDLRGTSSSLKVLYEESPWDI